MKAESPVHVPLHGAMVKIIYIKGNLIIQHMNSITLDIIDTEYLFASKKKPSNITEAFS